MCLNTGCQCYSSAVSDIMWRQGREKKQPMEGMYCSTGLGEHGGDARERKHAKSRLAKMQQNIFFSSGIGSTQHDTYGCLLLSFSDYYNCVTVV